MHAHRDITSGGRRAVVAWLIAYALVLQCLTAGFVNGAEPRGASPLASICTSGAAGEPENNPTGQAQFDHGRHCVLCETAGLIASDNEVERLVPALTAHAALPAPFERMAPRSTIAGQPGQPRAPPTVV